MLNGLDDRIFNFIFSVWKSKMFLLVLFLLCGRAAALCRGGVGISCTYGSDECYTGMACQCQGAVLGKCRSATCEPVIIVSQIVPPPTCASRSGFLCHPNFDPGSVGMLHGGTFMPECQQLLWGGQLGFPRS